MLAAWPYRMAQSSQCRPQHTRASRSGPVAGSNDSGIHQAGISFGNNAGCMAGIQQPPAIVETASGIAESTTLPNPRGTCHPSQLNAVERSPRSPHAGKSALVFQTTMRHPPHHADATPYSRPVFRVVVLLLGATHAVLVGLFLSTSAQSQPIPLVRACSGPLRSPLQQEDSRPELPSSRRRCQTADSASMRTAGAPTTFIYHKYC
jgi:hypothetical protein